MTPKIHTESAAAAERIQAVPRASFRFPLPFDPIRLLSGIAARWSVLAACGLAGLGLGSAAGLYLHKPSYTVSASLIKRKVPLTVQASETGQAYRPADLNDPTLLATLLATEPLERAVTRQANGLGARSVRGLVEASQQKGTDIYFVTYHSPLSPDDAVKFTHVWAEEISDFTKRLQQSDARGVRDILQSEVAEMETRLAALNRQMLDFSREKEFFGTDSQVTSTLNQYGQASLELESARASLEAKDRQIEALVTELRRQSPIDAQLKSAGEELAGLRSTYTDENPLVKAKLEGISYLEQKLDEFQGKGPASLEFYTGTPIGNQLFLDVLSLKNERTDFASKVENFTKLHQTLEGRVNELPAIVSRFRDFENQRAITSATLTLLSNRLKETEIFASAAPGYWQIFEQPEQHEIVEASKLKRPLIFGIAGAVAGTGIGLVLLILLTTRAARRSVIECCRASGAPLVIDYYANEPADAEFDRLWISTLAARLEAKEPVLGWSALSLAEDERSFWRNLSAAAARDGRTLPTVLDLTPDNLWDSVPAPTGLRWSRDLTAARETLLYRANELPSSVARESLGVAGFCIELVSGETSILKNAASLRQISAGHLPTASGTVAVIPRPASRIRQAGDRISSILARHFSRPLPVIPSHE